jgi:peptide/nickel transport system substrate-binding protein
LTLIQTGEVDLWPDVPPSYLAQVRALVRLPTDVHPGIFYEHLDFNVTRPLVSDVRVRQAIRYALDRRQIVKKIVHGYGTLQESTISPIFAFAPRKIRFVEHDANRAKRLLEEAGWKAGPSGVRVKNGRRLTLQLAYNAGASSLDDTVEMIREELRTVGIEVQARKYVPAMFFAPYQNGGVLYGAKWDMTMFAWGDLPVADISNLFACDQIPPKGQNVLRYCNPKLDQLLEAVKRTYDQHEQARLLDREERMIVGEAPTIVLYVFDTGYTHNKRLTGFHSEGFAPFDNIRDVDI